MNKKFLIKKGDKSGQFYLVATIIIVGLVITFAIISNSLSSEDNSELKKTAEELRIEGEKVLDYDLVNSADNFEDFSKDYSAYVGEDKEIYFIIVNPGNEEAYKYEGESKIDLSSDLEVDGDVVFTLDEIEYVFEKEEGKNFYFVVTQENGGEKYVFAG